MGSIAALTTGIAGKDFAIATGSTCTATTYATVTSCAVNVSFAPLAAGLRRGALVFYSGANNTGTVLASVPIAGIGNGPQAAFGPGGAQSGVGSGFTSPAGAAVDGAGNVFVADPGVPAVYKITPGGTQTTVGSAFGKPVGLAVDGAGNVYVADSGAAAVYAITPAGTQATVGSGFGKPDAVAVDGAGNVYVADGGKAAVYEITPGGTQTTVGSGFSAPAGVAVDAAGDVYVADSSAPGVYEIAAGGARTTVGGGFSQPEGVALDAAGDAYVVDQGTNTIYKITPGGAQSVVSSSLNGPIGLAIDGSGNLYVGNAGGSQVLKIDRADAPSVSFASTNAGSTSTDSPKTAEVDDIGNAALTLTSLNYPTDFPHAAGDGNACSGATSLSPAQQCDLPIDFTPLSNVSLSEHVTLTDNVLNVAGSNQSIMVNGTGTGVSAALISPTRGTVLTGPTVAFTWTAATGASGYSLWLGSTGVGSSNLYNSHLTTATSATAVGLPTNGEAIYARINTTYSGVTQELDYTYTAATQPPASLTSPLASSTLTGPTVTFTWTTVPGVSGYSLWLGNTGVGSSNLYNSHLTTATSAPAVGLPTNGETIYARINTIYNGVAQHVDSTYTAATQPPAALTSPVALSTLTGPTVAFTWTAATGASGYSLWLGSTGVGSSNLYNSHLATATSATAVGLPTNGETIYARINTIYGGVAQHTDYTYTAATQPPASITSPQSSSTLTGSTVTFTWTAATGASGYSLWLGSTGAGSSNLYNSHLTTATSATAAGLPTNGETIYARMNTIYNGVARYVDYTYTAQ